MIEGKFSLSKFEKSQSKRNQRQISERKHQPLQHPYHTSWAGENNHGGLEGPGLLYL